jgi:site-specific DNA-cytosine methylase
MDSTKAKQTSRNTLSRIAPTPACASRAAIHTAAVAAPSDPFNADGVVEAPSFVASRPLVDGALVDATVFAHRVEGKWIARVAWELTGGTCEGTYELPHRDHQRHLTIVLAVDAAGKVFLDQLGEVVGAERTTPNWSAEFSAVRAWLADIHHELCKSQADLPHAGRTTIELCAGTAVASMALQAQGATPLLVVEKDQHALATCQRNLRPEQVRHDLLEFDGTGWKCDFAIVGAVCTAHSRGGKRLGHGDKSVEAVHGAAIDALSKIDFKVAVVECAPELLEPQFKSDRLRWLKALAERGCTVRFRVLDAADFDLPQSRRRCFIVGTRGDAKTLTALDFKFPQALPHTSTVADVLEPHVAAGDYLSRIDPSEVVWRKKHSRRRSGLRELGRIAGKKHQGYRVYDPAAPVGPTLTATGGGRARCTGAYLIDGAVRGLTAREAWRMQGVPEWFAPDVNTGRALKQAGNALAYPVFFALGEQLAGVLNRRT